MANFYIHLLLMIFLIFSTAIMKGYAEQQQHITSLCSSSVNTNQNQTQSTSFCDCINESSSPWGLRILRIDCNSLSITYEKFDAHNLPLNAEYLDLSWNKFDEIPNFYGKGLRRLKFCHNQILRISDHNFANIPNLRELDISWNRIELISMNAFSELQYLQRLDLSHNNLKRINPNQFSPLISLEELNLSWNPKLNDSSELQKHDFYLGFGLTPKLKTLRIGHCNLNGIVLTNGVGLEQLHLDWNNLTIVSELPHRLKYLDLSGNPIEKLQSKTLPHLFQLETLLMEDMPILSSIDDYSLFGLPAMRILSFQNSRKLNEFHAYAFGMNVILNETDMTLEVLNLRGTAIKQLNSSLNFAFNNLKELHLAGTPLLCDCNLNWLQRLNNLETNGRCSEPSRLRGWKLSKVTEQQFDCKTSPLWIREFLNGLLILLLIILCVGGIWLIVLGLRPKKIVTIRKIGATSPYAPVTIEPNRAE